MGSISGVSGQSNAWLEVDTPRHQRQTALFAPVDANSRTNNTQLSQTALKAGQPSGPPTRPKKPVQRRLRAGQGTAGASSGQAGVCRLFWG